MACVVDVSDFGGASARRAFMGAFTGALYAANTEPLHLVLDEADLWAPQRTQPDGLDLLGRVEEIVRRGRVRGFVPWLITQRPAVLHKDVLSQADVLVSMKLTSSQEGPHRLIPHVDRIGLHMNSGIAPGEFRTPLPMRRSASSVEKARCGKEEGTCADGGGPACLRSP